MIAQKDFFKKFNISEDSLKKTELDWELLEAIYNAYEKIRSTLKPHLACFAECLRNFPKVHSVKSRLKDPEHLIEKIIRKKQENHNLQITTDNFCTVITDLIGLRVLHLFKEDWELVHESITKNYELKSIPVANIREGDQKEFTELFKTKGCKIELHPFGYRSVHYLIVSKPSKEEIVAEIQVRTIFEEGWSEIDHLIRYPHMKDNPILGQYLVMFNRLAGNADEMASYLMYLNATLKSKELAFNKTIEEKTEKNKELQKKIGELEAKIEKLKIDGKDKASLRLGLEQISGLTLKPLDFSGLIPKAPDFSGLIPKALDFSGLIPKAPDFSGLIPQMPDGSSGKDANQKSSGSNEEDKRKNGK